MGLRQLRRTEGSSPRVRGTPASTLAAFLATGIIPACAGNTPEARKFRDIPGDHPRVCGEHFGGLKDKVLGVGSSPRVRGTLRPSPVLGRAGGIIPACAGNTYDRSMIQVDNADHPRVCGEHLSSLFVVFERMGSSPRVRGTRTRLLHGADLRGIIPACAGNTRCRLPRAARWWDHPRVCGEHMNGD